MSAPRLTTQDAAALLGITPRQVRHLVRQGALAATREGHGNRATLWIDADAVLALRRARAQRGEGIGRPPTPPPSVAAVEALFRDLGIDPADGWESIRRENGDDDAL